MARVADQDSTALEELYDRYSTILYTLIRKIVVDKSISQEVLEEIFITIWQKKDKLTSNTDSVYTWLITFARNKAVDRKRREESGENFPDYTDEYEEQFILPRISKVIEPLDLNSAIGAKDKFEDALSKLTDAQKFVLYLAYYEGKTQSQIAAQLNIPDSTVKSKIQLSLSKLKQNLTSE
jgi:RNA polymerase sigma-70 factor (ECF subfamily)